MSTGTPTDKHNQQHADHSPHAHSRLQFSGPESLPRVIGATTRLQGMPSRRTTACKPRVGAHRIPCRVHLEQHQSDVAAIFERLLQPGERLLAISDLGVQMGDGKRRDIPPGGQLLELVKFGPRDRFLGLSYPASVVTPVNACAASSSPASSWAFRRAAAARGKSPRCL